VPGKRMTFLQQSQLTAWMLENKDQVARATDAELAAAVFDALPFESTNAPSAETCARYRKGLGIVAVKQTRKPRAKSTGWKAHTEARIAAIEAQIGIPTETYVALPAESQE
jgi:hypothetical protein